MKRGLPREAPIPERRCGKSVLDMKTNFRRTRTRTLKTSIVSFGTLSSPGVSGVPRLTIKVARID